MCKPKGLPVSILLLFLLSGIILFPGLSYATHNLAGQFTYVKTGTDTYEITLTTYTDPTNAGIDRCWADFEIYSTNGNLLDVIRNIPRSNGPATDQRDPSLTCPANNGVKPMMGIYIFPTIKMNIYRTTYTFSGPGNFLIGYEDLARIPNVANMTFSQQQAFYVKTLIRNNPGIGNNDSPFFLNHPIDLACTNKIWEHNPGGTDPEGDSLSYRLVRNLKNLTTPVDGYNFPDVIGGGTLSQDPQTGVITWNTPQQAGIYNLAFIVEEWRNGIQIGEAVRDMAVFVEPCSNDPPVIEAITDTCVEAGEFLEIDFIAYDPNPQDSIYFMLNNGGNGLNGPFASNISPNATISFVPNANIPVGSRDTIRGTVRWQTDCSHIRKNPYQIDFYAHDNLSYFNTNPPQMLSDHHTIQIRVNAPSTKGLTVDAAPRTAILNWDKYSCPNAIGYHIYRKLGGALIQPDTVCCDQSPVSLGFEIINSTVSLDDTSYTDDLSQFTGFTGDICYVVQAYFGPDLESCPTDVACLSLSNDPFYLTNDSIDVTDSLNGSAFVSWSQPDTSGINHDFYVEPFTYDLFRADGINGSNYVQVNTSPLNFSDTTFTDQGLNTADRGYRYRVEMHDQIGMATESNDASSIYLSVFSGDRRLDLEWSENVPWANAQYEIYRADSINGAYTFLALVPGTGASTHTYTDSGLVNGRTYCYFVRSTGEYTNLNGVKTPLINDSQKACEVPRDRTPPCFDFVNTDTAYNCRQFYIHLSLLTPDSSCAGDLSHFNIYRADMPGSGPWAFVRTIPGVDTLVEFNNLQSIADCYGITAVDTNGNESERIVYCFDNCPEFEPSNVFTPNGDGNNDWFSPFKERSVIVNEVMIFDRWGHKIYSVNRSQSDIDPRFLWNGNTDDGKPATEGVYYYIIRYETIRLQGNIQEPPINGYTTLLR